VIRNEFGTSMIGQGMPVPGGSALQWAWPEVWIPDEDVEKAGPIVNEFQNSQQSQLFPPSDSEETKGDEGTPSDS